MATARAPLDKSPMSATMAGALLYLEPLVTSVCLLLYPTLRWGGRRMGWAQEGAIASLSTMAVIAAVIFGLRGAEAGTFATVALAIVVIRHLPNLRRLF